MKKAETHKHLSELVRVARQKKGFATLRELYREKSPSVDYQTWLHAEAGRRIPHPNSLKEIGDILGVDKEDLIIAYCKDKFSDAESHRIVDSFLFKKFIDADTLLDARDHDRIDYVFSATQVEAMRKDLRVRLFLTYTYDDEDLKTSYTKLAQFFRIEKSEVIEVMERLRDLDLVTIEGEEVTRKYRHMSMPKSKHVLDLRRQLLLKGLDLNINDDSYVSNFHIMLSEETYKKIMAYIYFAEANFIKLAKEDKRARKTRIQIAIVANKITEDSCG